MKKIYGLAAASVFACSAAFAGSGMNNAKITTTTYVEPVVDSIVTVEQIPMMMDNQNVVMTGYLIENMGDNMYVFQDSTGTIAVEIEPMVMGEMVIMPSTPIKLKGEIDKGDNGGADVIEVDYISNL